ncbi:YkgJ family cysteine cluster protein [Candidatus Poribacteria bacterium]|nr:YkgJ family cysteine cluster protein [Candidatus Poribacteria bacterium]
MGNLWEECLECDSKCCNLDIAHPLFVTDDEMIIIRAKHPEIIESFNKDFPCNCLGENGLCQIHNVKPIDCRLFPFDVVNSDGKFFWIVREIGCPILNREERFEEYLQDFEKNIIPDFVEYLEAYSDFRYDELADKYSFKILREVKIRKK